MTMGSFFLAIALTTSADGSYVEEAKVPGATLRIEIQQPIDEKKAEQIVQWVVSTARTVNLTYGRFPSPNPKIVVIPSKSRWWESDSAVQFGQVTRRDGGTIELFVNADRPIEEFYGDWTATHEFSHLMLPLLQRRYRWISEGFATYYQNVLMSRGGRYTPESAWQRLRDGFARGRQSRPELSPNDAATRGIREARMKVYWSGAAIALLADVELRKRSGGEQSLDTVLGQLQDCCLPATRSWSGPALFRKLDSFLDSPVFMPLYRQHANAAGFPDIESTLRELGVSTRNTAVRLNNSSQHADIRREIFEPTSD